VTVNGVAVEFLPESNYRDPRFGCTSVRDFLRPGRNEIVLKGKPFSVRQEIAPLYLLGDFACDPQVPGFRLSPSRTLGWGSWKSQGLPFYDAEVSYSVRVPAGAGKLSFPRETWGGALIVVRQAGREIGRTYGPPWTIDLPSLSSRRRGQALPIDIHGIFR
jgi:hypothetical protein